MGVSVKLTKRLTAMAAAEVKPKLGMNLATMPPMKPIGTKTASRLKVVAVTARADLSGCFSGSLFRTQATPFHHFDDVLQDDDGVIDDDSYLQRQRQHGHQVQGVTEDGHQGETADDGGGNG